MKTRTRLSPEQFLLITDIAREWSLATTGVELVLFTRYQDDGEIYEFLGPNAFAYSQRELITFAYNIKNAIKRAKEKSCYDSQPTNLSTK